MNPPAVDIEITLGVTVLTTFVLIYSAELFSGHIRRAQRPLRDAVFSLFGLIGQPMVSGVIVGGIAGHLAAQWFPSHSNSLQGISFWLLCPLLFVGMELAHYTIHRYAHEWRWLWKIHRTHHSGLDMNSGLLYRYNLFWIFLLPQPWVGAFASYSGCYESFAIAVFITYIINVLTHTAFRWDLYLRTKAPWSEPLWWVLERTITLPDTHHAHHSYGRNAHPNGNYAVSLFLFDVVFGTAKIPNTRQKLFGLPIARRLHWAEEIFWPVVRKPLLPKAEPPQQS
ncbi:sterol desaturase/sphingolipid hydroxylase (fatty acid hydroxylase superfamily) [Sinobacterium caligoides]|uniref:Sterol desaturase/sphingolipid hydroxylase (Fatty acid hydroxylase superfamily) n=1 Tax=Sinobacterium caligoides TaxID=933926 RepID=A0A3N2E1E2_9GAMM|nr:sterol desaturase family protein [Sinobacterium caligoides]ROS05469.1 sterol desaturase/sphingolipid hydroxylase (fatty acid hydroxylase superfamily) [Sinobacterium caligoides]